MNVFGFILILLAGLLFAPASTLEPDVNAPNLGYVLFKKDNIRVIDATAKLTFVVKIPALVSLRENPPPICVTSTTSRLSTSWLFSRTTPAPTSCNSREKLHYSLRSLAHYMANEMNGQILAINEILNNFDTNDRRKRAWISFLGDALSTVTGVATEKELQVMQHSVQKLGDLVMNTSQIFTTRSNTILILKLTDT